jgi:hypothetical protein
MCKMHSPLREAYAPMRFLFSFSFSLSQTS